jgi:hypothetical protein
MTTTRRVVALPAGVVLFGSIVAMDGRYKVVGIIED